MRHRCLIKALKRGQAVVGDHQIFATAIATCSRTSVAGSAAIAAIIGCRDASILSMLPAARTPHARNVECSAVSSRACRSTGRGPLLIIARSAAGDGRMAVSYQRWFLKVQPAPRDQIAPQRYDGLTRETDRCRCPRRVLIPHPVEATFMAIDSLRIAARILIVVVSVVPVEHIGGPFFARPAQTKHRWR